MIQLTYSINGQLEYCLFPMFLYDVKDARREFRKKYPGVKILKTHILENVIAI